MRARVYGERVGRVGPAVALMQPTFLPWSGYFALIDAADVFVFLDDFQFQRRSWHHRNRIFAAPGKTAWITVPVAHTRFGRRARRSTASRPSSTLASGGLSGDGAARATVAPSTLEKLMPSLSRWIESDWASLADLNIAFIDLALRPPWYPDPDASQLRARVYRPAVGAARGPAEPLGGQALPGGGRVARLHGRGRGLSARGRRDLFPGLRAGRVSAAGGRPVRALPVGARPPPSGRTGPGAQRDPGGQPPFRPWND